MFLPDISAFGLRGHQVYSAGHAESFPICQNRQPGKVIDGLSRALAGSGNRAAVVMPLYRQARRSDWPFSSTGPTISVPLSYQTLDAKIFHAAGDKLGQTPKRKGVTS